MKCMLNVEPAKMPAILAERQHFRYVYEKLSLYLFSCQKGPRQVGAWRKLPFSSVLGSPQSRYWIGSSFERWPLKAQWESGNGQKGGRQSRMYWRASYGGRLRCSLLLGNFLGVVWNTPSQGNLRDCHISILFNIKSLNIIKMQWEKMEQRLNLFLKTFYTRFACNNKTCLCSLR